MLSNRRAKHGAVAEAREKVNNTVVVVRDTAGLLGRKNLDLKYYLALRIQFLFAALITRVA